jgi:transcription termination factor NusB
MGRGTINCEFAEIKEVIHLEQNDLGELRSLFRESRNLEKQGEVDKSILRMGEFEQRINEITNYSLVVGFNLSKGEIYLG